MYFRQALNTAFDDLPAATERAIHPVSEVQMQAQRCPTQAEQGRGHPGTPPDRKVQHQPGNEWPYRQLLDEKTLGEQNTCNQAGGYVPARLH